MLDENRSPYLDLTDLVIELADILRPPERVTVSAAAAQHRFMNNSGSFVGRWDNKMAPYLVEPMNCLTDRHYRGVIFCGPAQSGKTEMILNWIAYGVLCDPADFIVYEKSQAASRDFSKRRLDRMHRHSPEIGSKLIKRRDSDNTFDKLYMNGMMVTLSWPAINELSGRPIPRVALTDYDRMPEDIDGEGSPFDLAKKRTTTFRSFAKTLAESSPGYAISDVKHLPRTPHEAPPCGGILALYNRGDRRRFFWPCPRCEEFFEPEFEYLIYPNSTDLVEAAEAAKMQCPRCSHQFEHGIKYQLNQAAHWVRDGQKILRGGRIVGNGHRSDIASFWAKGVIAAFATWKDLVLNYLKAEQEYDRTGSQESLKTTVNTDQAMPYRMRGMEVERLPEELKSRADPALGEKVVPEGVRFLLAMCDVQKNRWVVQVFGVGIGGDLTVVDRFNIVKSNRLDEEGEHLWVKPATYLEDWDLLIEQVMEKTYPLGDGSGRRMQIKITGCDSGGKAGVSNNANDFWRKLREAGSGAHKRFALLKGDPLPGAPRSRISYPDSGNGKDRRAGARGEVPVLMLNVNVLKDRLNAMLDRKDAHGGLIQFPDWLEDDFYVELTVERRTIKGWENPRGLRNEAWDLFTYCVGMCVHLRVEHVDWSKPPRWMDVWDKNDLVIAVDSTQLKFVPSTKSGYDFAEIAKKLG